MTNTKLYARLTRIILALSLAVGIIGSIAFHLLKGIINNIGFSDF